jgi:hypothetical protein
MLAHLARKAKDECGSMHTQTQEFKHELRTFSHLGWLLTVFLCVTFILFCSAKNGPS